MKESVFVGREEELEGLSALTRKKSASFVVVRGRRRIGKSRLLAEFSKKYRTLKFTGLPPRPETTIQNQLDTFARQLSQATGLPEVKVDDWSKLLALLQKETQSGRVVVIFDEISWIGSKDPDFLGKLKTAWDDGFSRNPQLLFFVCGSISAWIEENILKSTAFYGRISWSIHLQPLPLQDCNALLEAQGFRGSSYEKFKVLSVTGGVPWYLEHIQGEFTADENIRRLCFRRGGLFVDEFEKVFHDIFGKRDKIYKTIIDALSKSPLEYREICRLSGYPSSGRLTEYLDDLLKAGFLSRDFSWSLKTGKKQSKSHFRISDNYLRFYLHYIAPRRDQIEKGRFKEMSLHHLNEWDSIMGLQFENLILNNRETLLKLLNLSPEDIVSDNPYYQKASKIKKGCQIDYLIQTRFNNFYLCEVKFSRHPIRPEIETEIKQKIEALQLPKRAAVLPVLIHVNGVSSRLEASSVFYKIIDFCVCLE